MRFVLLLIKLSGLSPVSVDSLQLQGVPHQPTSLTIGKQLQTEEPVQFILILSKDHCLEECDTVYIIIQTNFLNQCFQYKINLVSMSQGLGKSKINP